MKQECDKLEILVELNSGKLVYKSLQLFWQDTEITLDFLLDWQADIFYNGNCEQDCITKEEYLYWLKILPKIQKIYNFEISNTFKSLTKEKQLEYYSVWIDNKDLNEIINLALNFIKECEIKC